MKSIVLVFLFTLALVQGLTISGQSFKDPTCKNATSDRYTMVVGACTPIGNSTGRYQKADILKSGNLRICGYSDSQCRTILGRCPEGPNGKCTNQTVNTQISYSFYSWDSQSAALSINAIPVWGFFFALVLLFV
eukprot:TRINITY_DN709_c0_g1_i2.p1 TRINITY_DN709_c0_g1~~TRINITY_DN709_c0_g1_i2.p1  ORF type:complete len:134 (-),score=30.28 TRINITY_DN709_c0_g1_i2:86-487(-)